MSDQRKIDAGPEGIFPALKHEGQWRFLVEVNGKSYAVCLGVIFADVWESLDIWHQTGYPVLEEANRGGRTLGEWAAYLIKVLREDPRFAPGVPLGQILGERQRSCPTCGLPTLTIFDHIDIDCNSDMTAEQVAALLAEPIGE